MVSSCVLHPFYRHFKGIQDGSGVYGRGRVRLLAEGQGRMDER